jgi:hypothetical protein
MKFTFPLSTKFIFLFLLNLFAVSFSHAGMDIKPGQWKYENNIKVNGQQFNPSSQLEQAWAQLPPEQKAMMEKMMAEKMMKNANKNMNFGSMGSAGSPASPQVCITQEMIDQGNMAPPEDRQQCNYDIQKNTKDLITGSVTCKNKTKGTFSMKRVSKEKIEGDMKVTGAQGHKVNSTFVATWVSANCQK